MKSIFVLKRTDSITLILSMACKFLSQIPFTKWLLLLGLVACSPAPRESAFAGPEVYFPITVGDTELELQLAIHPKEQARGLMFREALAPRHGMLFVFAEPKQRSFWMRNTLLPLDLAYFDAEGRLVESHRLYPHDEEPVLSRSNEIKFALELEQGQMTALGIKTGDSLDRKALVQALTSRGLDPKSYIHTNP